MRVLEQRRGFVVDRLELGIARRFVFGRQLRPGELLVERERFRDMDEMVDRSGGARRHAIHAELAFLRVDHVVVGIVRDCVDRAGCLAGVAPDADRRIDQVLLDGRVHQPSLMRAFPPLRGRDHASFTYSKSPGLLSMPTFGGAIQLANLPGSNSGCISPWMNCRSASEGRNSLRRFCHSCSVRTLPAGSVLMLANSPICRWNATCGSLISNRMPSFSIARFQRPTPALQSAT